MDEYRKSTPPVSTIRAGLSAGLHARENGEREFSFSVVDFERVRKLIYQHAGISLSPVKQDMVYSRLARRLRATGMQSFAQYLDALESKGGDEWERFVNSLTTNLTSFFREAHHFDVLKRLVVPGHAPGRPLRVWSAACSSGEEPYSVAMVLYDEMGASGWEIMASDISQGTLAKAAAGLYRMERIDGIPQEYLKAFCLKGKGEFEGRLLISKSLRERVQFRQINLTDLPPDLGRFDVVLLRNVIIYFDTPTKLRVLESICDRLQPGGWLLLGHSESLAGFDLPLEQIRPAVYRRRD